MWSAGQTHFSPNYPLPINRTASYTISMHSYTSKSHIIYKLSINWYNSCNIINPRNTLANLNTVAKRLLSHTTNTSTLFKNNRPTLWFYMPPQEATTRKAAVSYDDNVRSLGDPGPLSTIGFTYNIQFPPPWQYPKYIHQIVRSLHKY